jgi:hypothetical protein
VAVGSATARSALKEGTKVNEGMLEAMKEGMTMKEGK